jgi:hypothetical protein
MTRWVRIGRGRPWPTFGNRHDSHHPGPSDWDIDGFFGYIDSEFYKELKQFTNFKIPEEYTLPKFTHEELSVGNVAGLHDQYWCKELNRLIKRAYRQVWQFNMILDPEQPESDYIRGFAVLGEKDSVQRWIWFGVHVQWPAAKLAVEDTMNKLRAHGSVYAPGFMKPEGSVLVFPAFGSSKKYVFKPEETGLDQEGAAPTPLSCPRWTTWRSPDRSCSPFALRSSS